MNRIKIILLFVAMLSFIAGCSDEVTRPQEQTDKFTVDATVDQTVVNSGDFVTPHADGRGGTTPYHFKWYERGEWIGVGEEPAPRQLIQPGFYTFLVVGVDSLGAVAEDSVTVTVLPPSPELPSVDATTMSPVIEVGGYARLHADGRGGTKPYQGYYWYLDDQNIGVGEDFTRQMPDQGIFTFVVVLHDSLGNIACDSVAIAVVAPNVIEVCVDTDLEVGPADRDDSEEVQFGQTGTGNVTVQMRFDTTEHRFVVLGFHYFDGSVRYFTVPDLGTTRPSYVLVDLGQVRVEPTMTISMRWTGSPSKCDQWVRAPRFCLSLKGPNKAVDGIPIIRLGEGENYKVIE